MSVAHVHILPDNVANLIAAGEVVERPASVVKELLENSLDAGARQIEVEIKDAGFSFLQVGDDGQGMPPEDAKLSFFRHATSKLSGAEDLNHITTLGFRGEALPSIAAVARVEMVTRPKAQTVGFRVLMEGGELKEEGETACAPGTTLTVRDLFFNTPARRKFMKTPATEQSHLVQAVEYAALSNPDVRFKLVVDGRETLNCPATDSLPERVASVYGKSAPQNLLVVNREGGGVRVSGLAAGPEVHRPTRQDLHFFVNGRPVEHRSLYHAVLEAYRNLLPPGRFPVCFLFLSIPNDLVDVNVHPAKREIRLRDEHGMHSLVFAAIRDALGQANLFVEQSAQRHPEPDLASPKPPIRDADAVQHPFEAYRPESPSWSETRIRESVANYLDQQAPRLGRDLHASRPPEMDIQPGAPEAGPVEMSEAFRIVGQVGRTYIAAQDHDSFFLVDQHAAHERLLYEELKQNKGPMPRQGLLLPLTFDLSPSKAALMTGLLDLFDALGIEIAAFGRNTFVIRTHPQVWAQGDLISMVKDLLDWVAELGKLPAAEELKDRTLKLMACHAAIKAGDRLQPEAMQALIGRLGEIPPPLTCPHGRPFLYRLTWQDLDKLFKRI